MSSSSTAATNQKIKIQVASDLHIEFYGTYDRIPKDILVPSAPILALVGDIGIACTETLRLFLLEQSTKYDTVIFVAGNHEFYNTTNDPTCIKTIDEQIAWIRAVCSERENLHFLEQESLIVNNVRISGTILWSNIDSKTETLAVSCMNDYRMSYIQRKCFGKNVTHWMTVEYTRNWHLQSVEWIKNEIKAAKEMNQRVVVLTHHTPTMDITSKPEDRDSPLKSCFSTDLEYLFQDPTIYAWVYGHTHFNINIQLGSTILTANQKGYPEQPANGYDNNGLVLEI